jgi:aryl-alcohol dehydrogenase-like predicted oxidoreductase
MIRRKLGHTGLDVSAIGLGCMSFAGFYADTSEAETFACLDAARDEGVDFLDTAEIYGTGLSETRIGDYQKSRGMNFTIATKGGIKIGGARGECDNSDAGLRNALEGSLKRLQTDHVALYYVHRRDWSIPIEEVTGTLSRFVEEGKIGGIGFSEIAPTSLRKAAAVFPVSAIQNEYSLWTRYPDLGLIQTCAELGTAFVAFSPLGRGILTDRDLNPPEFKEGDFRKNNPRFLPPNFSANCVGVKKLRRFAGERGYSTAALAIAWTLDQGDHVIPIPGTRSAESLREWAVGAKIELSEDDRLKLAQLMPVGWAHGDRYSDHQIIGIERYC